MKVNVCVGNYAKTPYDIDELQISVFCMEELCYCMRENAFLLDMSIMNTALVDWIAQECGLSELAKELYPMVRKSGSLSVFVTIIMEYVGIFESDEIMRVEQALRAGSGLSNLEKRKRQVDYLVKKGKGCEAIRRYDELLKKCSEEFEGKGENPLKTVQAAILHNKGVALASMLEYGAAAECFYEAQEIEPNEVHFRNFLAAKRMELDEEEYLSFLAEKMDYYEESLTLEKRIEQLSEKFRESEEWHRLSRLWEWREGSSKQRYYDEVENITQALKESYRDAVDG